MYIFIYSPTKYILSSHNVQYSYIYFDSMDIVPIFTPDKQITNIIHLLNYNTMTTDTFKLETLLYGCKIGQPDYMEEILYQCKGYVNKEEVMTAGEAWAAKNGYDRLRLSVVDLSTPPNFAQTVSI